MQAAHAAALFAATHAGAEPSRWAHRTLVLHAAPLRTLCELIAACDGRPFEAGCVDDAAWFVEEDLLWEPTAVAAVGATADLLRPLPLWAPPGLPAGGPDRRWWCDLSAAVRRDGLGAAELWSRATDIGDPSQRHVRGRVAHLLVRGEEAPELS